VLTNTGCNLNLQQPLVYTDFSSLPLRRLLESVLDSKEDCPVPWISSDLSR
jgi:hypothetical protein